VSAAHRVGAAALAGLTTAAARRALDASPPGGAARWTRTNHRGEPVSMLEGPAVAAGLLVGGAAGAGDGRSAAAWVVATGSASAFGLVDDLAEDTSTRDKGLRGHLGALAHGRLTTGGLKVLGIGTGALAAAALAPPARGRDGSLPGPVARLADVAVSGALVAATANLVNLLDLRPGRALKAGVLTALPGVTGAGGAGGAAVLGAAVAAAGADLDERDMLGDGGANALGAALGMTAVLGASRPVRVALLVGAVALTLASERVSFTQVIGRTPVLRELDAWGRRPAAGATGQGAVQDGVAPQDRTGQDPSA